MVLRKRSFGLPEAVAILTLFAIGGLTLPEPVFASGSTTDVAIKLTGFEVVPNILTNASGVFKATIDPDATLITYSLTYGNLSSQVSGAYIQFGQRGINGEKFVFLCGGGDKPVCPPGGTVKGEITAADILSISGQGLASADFDGALRIIASGDAYINVHTMAFPGGEIRGQIGR